MAVEFFQSLAHSFRKKDRSDNKEISAAETVAQINSLEVEITALNETELLQKTIDFRRQLAQAALLPEENERVVAQEKILNQILPEAFAVVREVSKRQLGLRHYDEQLMGGIALHQGKAAEVKTGEGKTLMATLALYLNALVLNPTWVERALQEYGDDPATWNFEILDGVPVGKGVHLVTVNDYLSQRDAGWMNPIYEPLGLNVGVLQNSDQEAASRQSAYQADITYGTKNEFGFDYLRDNLVRSLDEQVQREHHFAVVDEVDSILVDEARTPLILAGPEQAADPMYNQMAQAVRQLEPQDYVVDEVNKNVSLTSEGEWRLRGILGLPKRIVNSPEQMTRPEASLEGFREQALRAQFLFILDRDYLIDGDPPEVIIIDQFTHRKMPGRQWKDGLHQAVQAKEGVRVKGESETLAMITLQSYFSMYEKLAGMTGTAESAEMELKGYGMETEEILPHVPSIRADHLLDVIYRSEAEKFSAIIAEIKACHESGQPILVGTASVEKSEYLAALLEKEGVPCQVLNARKHDEEAQIVAKAGALGAVTIATNMAGRGVDIKLGGELPEEIMVIVQQILQKAGHENSYEMTLDEMVKALEKIEASSHPDQIAQFLSHAQAAHNVKRLGGLRVIGSERYESRRIDNQLRGRAGRQGDPGSTQFILSLGDDLIRYFGGREAEEFLVKLGEGGLITDAEAQQIMDDAQARAEENNSQLAAELSAYDQALSIQRDRIYTQRERVLTAENLSEDISRMIEAMVASHVEKMLVGKHQTEQFLTTLESIQPTFSLGERTIPSFAVKLLVEKIKGLGVTTENAVQVISEVATTSFEAKKETALNGMEELTISRQVGHRSRITDLLTLLEEGFEISLEECDLDELVAAADENQLRELLKKAVEAGFEQLSHVMFSTNDLEESSLTQALSAQLSKSEGSNLSDEQLVDLIKIVFLNGRDGVLPWGYLELISGANEESNSLWEESLPEVTQAVTTHFQEVLETIVQEWSQLENGSQMLNQTHREILRNLITQHWVSHLTRLEITRTAVSLEAYAQQDPLVVYKKIANTGFTRMMDEISSQVVAMAFRCLPPDASNSSR
jgi:preprotein translocase subunit SecA